MTPIEIAIRMLRAQNQQGKHIEFRVEHSVRTGLEVQAPRPRAYEDPANVTIANDTLLVWMERVAGVKLVPDYQRFSTAVGTGSYKRWWDLVTYSILDVKPHETVDVTLYVPHVCRHLASSQRRADVEGTNITIVDPDWGAWWCTECRRKVPKARMKTLGLS